MSLPLPDAPRPVAALAPGVGAPWAVVLGTAQDGGHPQTGCSRPCCEAAWEDPARAHLVASLGIVDPGTGRRWLVEATPDLPRQLRWLDRQAPGELAGVLLTHAHIGHYTGLVHVGPEGMAARGLPLYAMPRMRRFLTDHGPWSVLVGQESVRLVPLGDGARVELAPGLSVVPFLVPHRDELSETVGFRIEGPNRAIAWLPDIDAWDRWGPGALEHLLAEVDVAWLDGTFFQAGEVPGRDPSKIPHPPIVQTMARLADLPATLRRRVRFVHLNHTNPALDPDSEASVTIAARGFAVAREGEQVGL